MKQRKISWLGWVGLIGGGLCILSCLAVGALALLAPTAYQAWLSSSSIAVGQPAPDFELPTLSGERVNLSQLQGQPVVLSIGATWCPDCRHAAPLLQQLHEQHPQLAIVAVESKESLAIVRAFAAEFGLTYTLALDANGATYQAYRILAIPTLFFIDEQGIIRARLIESVSQDKLENSLKAIGVTQ